MQSVAVKETEPKHPVFARIPKDSHDALYQQFFSAQAQEEAGDVIPADQVFESLHQKYGYAL